MGRFLVLLVLLGLPLAALAETGLPRPEDDMQALLMLADGIKEALPEARIEVDEADISLAITLPGEVTITAYADNLFVELRAAGSAEERSDILANHIAGVRKITAELAQPSPFDVTQVYPILRDPAGYPGSSLDTVATADFPGGLVELWVQDTPASTSTVSKEEVTAAHLEDGKLGRQALENLRRKAGEAVLHGNGGVRMLTLDGYYESSLMLLPELWQGLDQSMGTIVTAIPSRDVLLIADGDVPGQVEDLRAMIAANADMMAYPITTALFRWDGDHWTLLPESP